jgi:hypothetical protein
MLRKNATKSTVPALVALLLPLAAIGNNYVNPDPKGKTSIAYSDECDSSDEAAIARCKEFVRGVVEASFHEMKRSAELEKAKGNVKAMTCLDSLFVKSDRDDLVLAVMASTNRVFASLVPVVGVETVRSSNASGNVTVGLNGLCLIGGESPAFIENMAASHRALLKKRVSSAENGREGQK